MRITTSVIAQVTICAVSLAPAVHRRADMTCSRIVSGLPGPALTDVGSRRPLVCARLDRAWQSRRCVSRTHLREKDRRGVICVAHLIDTIYHKMLCQEAPQRF